MLESQHKAWTIATAELPWAVQHAMHETLKLVAEGKVTMVYGADYRANSPCLVNAIGAMTQAGGGHGIPSKHFGDLVSAFDSINYAFESIPDYNDANNKVVNPNTAEVLVHWFAPLKDKPETKAVVDNNVPDNTIIYVEPSDESILNEWTQFLQQSDVTPEPTSEPSSAETAQARITP